ncbi:MAG: hypothetical protein AAFU80_07000 [Pseudomonadota bacterium]
MTRMDYWGPSRACTLAVATASLALVAACAPPPPPADSGVGFGDYESYLANRGPENVAREAQLRGETTLPPEATGAPEATLSNPTSGVTASDLAAAGIGVDNTTGSPAPVAATQQQPAAPQAPLAAPGIQTANAGGPVAPQSVAAAAPTAAEPVIQREAAAAPAAPTPISAPAPQPQQAAPVRPVADGPDIVAFALSTNHAVGSKQYDRGLISRSQAGRNCARFHGADQAQRTFLESGGPFRDRYGLDPDGDGFACDWSPEPFRSAVRG